MAGKNERSDFRVNVARYLVDQIGPTEPTDAIDEDEAAAARAADGKPAGKAGGAGEADEQESAGQPTMEQRAQYVEIQIEQAMRRGEFDNLPGAGKPLTDLNPTYDPDWWIRKKIEREQITGLGPPALTLRTEDAALNETLDGAPSEEAVREALADFNKRIIEARRQLLGGPPVVTQTRDVEDEVERWNQRRAERYRERQLAREQEAADLAAMTRRERRRAQRNGR